MVLTRRQEAMLMRQYHGVEIAQGQEPGTPETPVRQKTLPDGRQLKSALKMHTRLRPWESDDEDAATPPGATIKKKVRIHSKENMVHVFEKDASHLETTEDVLEEDFDDEEHVSPVFNKKNVTFVLSMFSRLPRNHPGAVGVLAILIWAVSSSWLIFLNRDLMKYKSFPFPLMLPAISQLGCAVLALFCGGTGLVTIRPLANEEFSKRLFPLAVCAGLSMFLGNYAYLGLSLAFLNILKALVPAVTLILGAGAGLEHFTSLTFASTLLIAYGTGMATLQETSLNTAFDWPCFIAFALSVLFEGIRVVMAAKLLGCMSKPYTPWEMLAYVGPAAFLLMGGASVVVEGRELMNLDWATIAEILPDLLLVILMSFLVNVSSYYSIKYTSSTTFKVFGCFKNAIVVWMGMMQGDMVTGKQWQGFAVSSAGFLLYTWAKNSSIGDDDKWKRKRS